MCIIARVGELALDRWRPTQTSYPWHTDIVATTFWVGEIFDPDAPDGSQVISTYDGAWLENYGGCDGIEIAGECRTEPRTADNNYAPSSMIPKQNPFYLDLPYDDVNDKAGFALRRHVIPWADQMPYKDRVNDAGVSLMKDRWVMIRKGDRVCYGQIEDAGPGQYADADYVFGTRDQRPLNKLFNGAGMDVSPALNGCLGFAELDGQNDLVDWRFVDEVSVPRGPWTEIITKTTW